MGCSRASPSRLRRAVKVSASVRQEGGGGQTVEDHTRFRQNRGAQLLSNYAASIMAASSTQLRVHDVLDCG